MPLDLRIVLSASLLSTLFFGCSERGVTRADTGARTDTSSLDAPSVEFPDAVISLDAPTPAPDGFAADAPIADAPGLDARSLDAQAAPDARAAPADAFGDVPCGRLGATCCAGTCTEGACLTGRCVAYAGSFQRDVYTGGGACLVRNRFTAACMCPAGFTEQRVEDVDYGVDEGSGFLGPIYVCHASTELSRADFRGAHGRVTADYPFSSGCTVACTSPAPATGSCSCPTGTTTESRYESIHFVSGSTLDCERELSFCGGATPLTFGGTYYEYRPGDRACDMGLVAGDRCIPNAVTGACSCPAGFTPTNLQVSVRRVIDRGFGAEQWLCPGNLAICEAAP